MKKLAFIILGSIMSLTIQAQNEDKNQNKGTGSSEQVKKSELKEIEGIKISSYIQKQSEEQNKTKESFDYEEVVNTNLSKTQLWINLKKWVSSKFTSYQHVVDMEDKEAGVLIIKCNSSAETKASSFYTTRYEASFQIDVRDKKYRIKVSNPVAHNKPKQSNVKAMSTYLLELAQKDLKEVVSISELLQGTPDWSLDEKYINVMNSKREFYTTMLVVKMDYEEFRKKIVESLKSSMLLNDDF